jgi:hypothetical protein
VKVSNITRPVTQVAEVAVNRAGRNPQEMPLREAAGRVSRPAPSKTIQAKVMAMIFIALKLFGLFFIQKENNLARRVIHPLLSDGNTSP